MLSCIFKYSFCSLLIRRNLQYLESGQTFQSKRIHYLEFDHSSDLDILSYSIVLSCLLISLWNEIRFDIGLTHFARLE